MSDARGSLLAWLERCGGSIEDYAFPSRIDHTAHMSTRQYARLVDEWVTAVGLRSEDYGTHSLRRTKASIIYKATGNLRAVQILLGHTKIENTVRSEEHTSDLQSLMRISYAVFCLKNKKINLKTQVTNRNHVITSVT